jgi:quinoprotein glucose dehydrogenase
VPVERPISVVIPPDDSGRHFLVQQRGRVIILPKDETSADAKTFLDLTGIGMEAKDGLFEEGLIGFAFHPKFKDNGKFYICHSAQELKRSVYVEYKVDAKDPDKADPASARVLLEVPQPFWNHNSGNMAFGPDGLLYLTLGDGGKGGDPLRTAQNTFNLLGKMLRIDVDRAQGGLNYGIPQDNPFVSQPGIRPEIYALGLRNPWGIHFDSEGTLWLADVGQELAEEINLITKGGNYGWSFREGFNAYPPRANEVPPEGTTFIDPIHAYDHTQGISITGGFVYQGKALPELAGSYLYGDWGFGTIWALKYDKAAKKVVSNTVLLGPQILAGTKPQKSESFKAAGFSADANGEVLALDWMGKIWRLAAK